MTPQDQTLETPDGRSLLVESERDQVYRAIEDWLQSM